MDSAENLAEPEAESDVEVVLVDGEGEPLDMASEESAEALTDADPYFKVGTTTYRFFAAPGVCTSQYPGDPNCFDNQGADVIQDAINYIRDNGTIPSDGKIYVEKATYTSNVTINGSLANLDTLKAVSYTHLTLPTNREV